jgi:hypothetical protein
MKLGERKKTYEVRPQINLLQREATFEKDHFMCTKSEVGLEARGTKKEKRKPIYQKTPHQSLKRERTTIIKRSTVY